MLKPFWIIIIITINIIVVVVVVDLCAYKVE